ncbi:WYL domain-containing protein [Shewanella japonica]|uniref:Transcriptional regulator n=1 Tax=Shewanella japonica TaxID=93973 RepID=A0ABN4Y8W6_9GAMM|nr:WYL domain-containing protein [Shewanella japonica]ARD20852.1 transcriptional regulator [Shewanella japonica]
MTNTYSFYQLQSEIKINAERLAYIDFKLRFTGVIKRQDLYNEFGLAEAAASRMITLYKQYRKDNFFYDSKVKVNSIKLDSYVPLIPLDSETGLGMLANGFNKNKMSDRPVLEYKRIGRISNQLNIENVSVITRAMSNHQAISCKYISGNSSNYKARELVPLSLMNDGKNWKFRAYDRSEKNKEKRFKNFNFSRVASVENVQGDSKKGLAYESLKDDYLWNLQVPIALELHPSLNEEQKQTVRKDFGLSPEDSEIFLTESAALVWILTKLWFIDVGKDNNEELFYNFELKNREMLKNYI